MNKLFKILLIYFFITGCSFQKNSKFWNNNEKIVEEKRKKITEIFKKEETLNSEFNQNLKIKLEARATNNNFLNNLNNNDGRINYNGNLENISKYKFKKIN